VFVRAGEDLREHRRELAALAASATDVAACSVMLLSGGEDEAPRLKLWCCNEGLPASASDQTTGRGERIAGRVLEQGKALLIPDIRQSEFAALARSRENVAALIGKSVQVERLQTLIRSRVAPMSLAKEEKRVVAQSTEGAVPPARVAKPLAKSLFRDLAAAGSEPGQTIEAASAIIALVSTDRRRYQRRTAPDSR